MEKIRGMKKCMLALGFLGLVSLASAQKKVLFEKFTNAYCGVCPDASLQLKEMTDQNADLIWISHHRPNTFTDNPLNNERSTALWTDLNIAGVPSGMVDRIQVNNSITISRSLWDEKVQEQLDGPTAFDIEIGNVSYDLDTRELDFEVSAEVIADAAPGPYRLTAYIVEDSCFYRQHSYWNDEAGHPLEGLGDILWGYPHINMVRTIMEDHWGSAGVIPDFPEVGTSYSHNYTYTIPAEYKAKDIKIVAMVALFDEVNVFPGEIQNANQLKLKDLNIAVSSTDDVKPLLASLSPQPARDILELSYEFIPSEVMILDMHGQLIQRFTPNGLKNSLDLSTYRSGNYFVMINNSGSWTAQLISVVR